MKNKLYNVYFPIWLLIIFPAVWLIALPVNFALDSAVLWIAMAALHLTDKGKLYRRTILWIWLFGFLADLLGGALLLWASTGTSAWWYENIALPISLNPFSSVYGFIFVLLVTIFSGALIYVFNYFITFRRAAPNPRVRRILSLVLAIATAPYLFFVPTKALYNNNVSAYQYYRICDKSSVSLDEIAQLLSSHTLKEDG